MRRSIKKPSQKSPMASRRRSEANRPPSSSSSSGASKATLAPEQDATARSPSPLKSSRRDSSERRSHSRTPKKVSSKRRSSSRPKSPLLKSPPRPKSPVQASSSRPKSPLPRSPTEFTSPTKRTRSRTPSPIASPGTSPQSPPKTRSPKKKATPSKSPIDKRSPAKDAATVKSPTKRKHPKSPSKPDSLSQLTISETVPETHDPRISRSTPFGKTLEKLEGFATSRVQEVEGGSTKKAPDGKSYVFVPTSEDLDQEVLGRLMSQLYGYLKTLREVRSASCSTEPSAPPYETDTEDDDLLEVVVIGCRKPLSRDDPAISEQLIKGVSNLGYVSSSSPTKAPETSSSSSSSTTLTNPKGTLKYNPDLTKRRHSADASVGSSYSAPGGVSRPSLLRQRHVDFDSNCSIQVLELEGVPETPKTPSPTPGKRRHSKDKDRDADREDAPPPKPARKKSFDSASRYAQDKRSPPKQTRVVPDPPPTSSTAYRDVRRSLESEEDAIEVLSALRSESTDSPQPRNDFRDWCSESFTASWDGVPQPQNWTPSSSPAVPSQCFWQVCYKRFIDSFEESSATAQQFFQNLTGTLVQQIRRPGQPASRRYVCIAGYHIWVLIREASNDFWFLCGGGSNRTDSPNRIPGPTLSLQSFSGADIAQPQQQVRNLSTKAQKNAAKAELKARQKEQATIGKLIELIHKDNHAKRIEPRRDFVPNDCPFITVSFEGNAPEEPAVVEVSAEASDEAASETKPRMSRLTVPERRETEAMPPRRRGSAKKKE